MQVCQQKIQFIDKNIASHRRNYKSLAKKKIKLSINQKIAIHTTHLKKMQVTDQKGKT